MSWQDITISILTLLFGYALIPQVYHGFKIKKTTITIQTALITCLGLYILAITFLTLNFYFSFAMDLFTGTLWLVLLIQCIVYREKNHKNINSK
ncbi:MAG TPA: hypothetical protein P5277_04630 [Candidatus Paceibacterota bacterium]|nr:hypothetical protein [Candidatus Paceibacterota bacterium]